MKSKESMASTQKSKLDVFSVLNGIFFLITCVIIIIPLVKVFVDSIDAKAAYGMNLWPNEFSLSGYKLILSTVSLYKPFFISCLVTVLGTCLGLLLSTLGAYVLIQFEMPGRTLFSYMLLFTMIFQAGMVPMYLNMKALGLTNTLWSIILPGGINIYNLILMRNFFEGIPISLFESAELDGCSPMQTFIRIVLPMSKAALASIGLMFAVTYWNDYTHYKLYINNSLLYNFQMKLRDMVMGSDIPLSTSAANENTIRNAAIIVAIIPFMILYPCLQKYFVKGVNIGAVKE